MKTISFELSKLEKQTLNAQLKKNDEDAALRRQKNAGHTAQGLELKSLAPTSVLGL